MKTKIFVSLRAAFPRFILGAVGIWCSLGPIILFNASGSASLALMAVLVLLLLLCYAVVIVICLRAKWDALKELVSETRLAMCFMIIGLLTNEITGTFVAIKHKLVIVYAFVGFLIAELIKPKINLSNSLEEFKRDQTADPIKPATESERSEEHSSAELSNPIDELAKDMAVHSTRLAENQRTLAECDKEQPRLVSAGTENEQLQEMINSFRNQLKTSESQLKQSTARIQEAVDLSATLHAEIAALKQQIAEREDAIETLQSAAQRMAKTESETHQLSFENQRLQEQLTSHRMQLNASETRLQELARRNQEVSDCYEGLESEVADLRRWPKDSHSKDREIEIARQQLAIVESREITYRQQQQQLEARIVDLERELSEGKNQVQLLDDTRQRLRETERACWELAEENRRLWAQASLWQERLAASAESQREVSILRQQIHQLQSEHARLINGKRQAQEEFTASGESRAVTRLVADCNGPEVIQTTTNAGAELSLVQGRLSGAKVHKQLPSAIAILETKSLHNRSQETRGSQSRLSSGDSVSAAHMEKEEDASWVVWTSVKRQWRFGAVAATVVVIAGAVAMGIRGTQLSASKEAAVAPETSFQEYAVEAVSKPQKNSAPRLRDTFETVQPTRINSGPTENAAPRRRGTFETVQPTRLYSGPSEDSALIADIGAGMKVNVVDSSYGWLEIRSKHGRPPGFIRQEAAVRIAWN